MLISVCSVTKTIQTEGEFLNQFKVGYKGLYKELNTTCIFEILNITKTYVWFKENKKVSILKFCKDNFNIENITKKDIFVFEKLPNYDNFEIFQAHYEVVKGGYS